MSAVEVQLDNDGVAEIISLRADGLNRIDGGELGAMVVAADTAAAVRFGRVFSDALVSDRPDRADPVEAGADPGVREPRPLADLTSRALAAFERLAPLATSPLPAVGEDGPVRITVTLERITECWIEPRWLAQADRSALADALQRALDAARTAYRRARRPVEELNNELAELLGDIKATLHTYARGV